MKIIDSKSYIDYCWVRREKIRKRTEKERREKYLAPIKVTLRYLLYLILFFVAYSALMFIFAFLYWH